MVGRFFIVLLKLVYIVLIGCKICYDIKLFLYLYEYFYFFCLFVVSKVFKLLFIKKKFIFYKVLKLLFFIFNYDYIKFSIISIYNIIYVMELSGLYVVIYF